MDPKDITGHAPAASDPPTSGTGMKVGMLLNGVEVDPVTHQPLNPAVPPVPGDPEFGKSPEEVMPSAGDDLSANATPAPVAAVVPEPVPAPADSRQWWECVTPEGPRTRRNGVECPEFQSDSHIVGHLDEHGYPQPPVPVKCPTCGGKSIRKQGARTLLNEAGRALPPLHG